MTEARPAIEPTDKSISPEDKTNVIATAIMAIIAVCLVMFKILFMLRNPLSYNVRAKKRKTKTNPI